MAVNTARAPSHFSPGGLLDGGKYRIIRQLGAGGMGAVFEAENTLTRKRVAIKCLHAGRASHPDATARLLREAEAASRIRHPHVVDVYDVGRDADSVFLVMEYLEGEPLSQLLARGGMTMHALIALLLPAMRAVAEAHRLGVVHRDIKPDNIFLAREADAPAPVPKVLDFGISKLSAQDGPQASLTLSGSTLGTPRYMAYEQLMSDKTIDGRVDVYAFGVILYEALTGQPPFDAETYPELIVKIANGAMMSPKQLRAELPSTLDRLVCWALERDRERRISSMPELIRELEPFATERGMLAEMNVADREAGPLDVLAFNSTVRSKPPTRAAAPAQPSAAAPSRRRRTPWVVAASVLLLGLAWLLFGRYGSRSRLPNTPTASFPAASAATSTGSITSAESLDRGSAGGWAPVPPTAAGRLGDTLLAPGSVGAPGHVDRALGSRPPTAADAQAPTPAHRPEQESATEGPSQIRSPATRAAHSRKASAAAPHRAEAAAQTPPDKRAEPAQPAAATDQLAPPAVRPQESAPERPPAPAPSTFRVKLPQSKEF